MYESKPYSGHEDWPPISLFNLSDDTPQLNKISCMFCKATLCRISNRITAVVFTPSPASDFDNVTEILCKKCKQMYRLCNIAPENVVDLTNEEASIHHI